MLLPRIAMFNVQQHDLKQPYEQLHLFTEVVLLYKTMTSHCMLYQVHMNAIQHMCPSSNITFRQHAQLICGQVSSIDKQNKTIYLSDYSTVKSDYSTVKYKHLIIICGDPNDMTYMDKQDAELAAALSTLKDALKLQNIQNFMNAPQSASAKQPAVSSVTTSQPIGLAQVIQPFLLQTPAELIVKMSEWKPCRLYEVQP